VLALGLQFYKVLTDNLISLSSGYLEREDVSVFWIWNLHHLW